MALLLAGCVLPFWACASTPYDKNTWRQPDTSHRIKPILALDNRFSVIHGAPTSFIGIKTGIQFKRRYRAGIGFFFTSKPVEVTILNSEKYPGTNVLESSRFYYGTVFGEFIVLKRMRWEIALPLHFGFGGGYSLYYNKATRVFLGRSNTFVALTEISPLVTFRFCRWMGLGAGLGYRVIFNRNPDLRKAYDAPIVIFRIRFYFNELVQLMQHKLRIGKKYRQ